MKHKLRQIIHIKLIFALMAGFYAFSFGVGIAHAATLTSASLSLSDSRPSQTAQYTMKVSGLTTGTSIGCIELDMGTAADGSGTVTSLSTSSSTFVSQSITASGTWAADNTQSASQKLRMTNATPVAPQSGSQTAVWGAITNGNTADTSYFGVFKTYTDNTCATPVDSVTVQFVYTAGQAVSLTVDPTLTFSVAGTSSGASCNGATSNVTTTNGTIPLGTPTVSANKIGVQNLTVTTNAGSGYSVYTRYTAKPTSGSNTIADHSGSNTSPTAFPSAGTEAFGYTTNDSSLGTGTANRFTSTPNVWAAFTTTNAEVAYNGAAVSNQTTCVGQQVGISGTTPAGSYTTTVIYTATPVY